jgi:hypothetical protein
MHQNTPLLRALRCPQNLISLTAAEWNLCLPQARRARVLGRLGVLLNEQGLLQQLPEKMREHLDAARAVSSLHERTVRWEVNRLERVLAHLNAPVVLLKGAAYVMAGLPPARGRLYSDVDILVPKERLAEVESTLLTKGWETTRPDRYDQRYYRIWMHELPPLQHSERMTALDVHHAILPETGRLHPDSALLLDSAQFVSGTCFKVLAPADMILHSAAHMFQDGELAGSLRDLTDLDDLLRYFGGRDGFWEELVTRARRLGLLRPLFYALHYAQQILDTPVRPAVQVAVKKAGGPPALVLHIMDALVDRALVPTASENASGTAGLARWLLYIRSHWLRMPPLLLTRHLFQKSLRRRSLEPDRPQPNQP